MIIIPFIPFIFILPPRCLGTIQHLKSKFDSGYLLSIQLKARNLDQILVDDEGRQSLHEEDQNCFRQILGCIERICGTSFKIVENDQESSYIVVAIPR